MQLIKGILLKLVLQGRVFCKANTIRTIIHSNTLQRVSQKYRSFNYNDLYVKIYTKRKKLHYFYLDT